MSVLIEGFSVVIRKRTLETKYPGGVRSYRENCPNRTYCADEYLTRVGFMRFQDVQFVVGQLCLHGFAYGQEAGTEDICVVNGFMGPTQRCSWIEFETKENGVSHCWLSGTPKGRLAHPPDWTPRKMGFAKPGELQLRTLGASGGLDVFQDEEGKQIFVGSPYNKAGGQDPTELRRRAFDPDARWAKGERLGGTWPIYQTIHGGMGIVHIVYDEEMGKLFAAKTFQDTVFSGPRGAQIIERFKQEARIWIGLGNHPNIVQAHKIREIGGKPYLFLEYVECGSLVDWIGTPKLLNNQEQAVRFGLDLCAGMKFACKSDLVIHRDLKPANCLVTKGSHLKVTDFGLAKAIANHSQAKVHPEGKNPPNWKKRITRLLGASRDIQDWSSGRVTQAGSVMGTPPYMSPEQFQDATAVDVRSDIYAFGIIMYEMISGRVPFRGRSFEEFARLHAERVAQPLVTASVLLWDGIAKCLEKRPEDRFQDFGDVEKWLCSIQGPDHKSTSATPTDNREQTHVWRAVNAANLGDYSQALKLLDQAIDQDSQNVSAWSIRGDVLQKMGEPDAALASHNQAISLSSDFPKAWCAKGKTLLALGRLEEALKCHEESIRLNPADSEVWYEKGVVFQRLNRIDEAAKCWDQCLQLDPGNSNAWCNRGAAYSEQGRHGEAVSCLRRALVIDPRDQHAWANLGTLEAMQGNLSEAIKCLETAEGLGLASARPVKEKCIRQLQAQNHTS